MTHSDIFTFTLPYTTVISHWLCWRKAISMLDRTFLRNVQASSSSSSSSAYTRDTTGSVPRVKRPLREQTSYLHLVPMLTVCNYSHCITLTYFLMVRCLIKYRNNATFTFIHSCYIIGPYAHSSFNRPKNTRQQCWVKEVLDVYRVSFFLWSNSPTRTRAASFLRFLAHIQ